jgi:dolichol-phosphate mannosyltransferase
LIFRKDDNIAVLTEHISVYQKKQVRTKFSKTNMSCSVCSIIIPAYNESKRISPLLLDLSQPDIEFIFVCDGSDTTAEIIKDYSEDHPDLNIRILKYNERLGKGGGVYAGFREASSSIVGFMDADNSTPVSELIRISALIGENSGIIGSRHLPYQVLHRKQPLNRRLQSRIFNSIIRLLFGLPFHDTQCGAKMFRKEAIDAVLPDLKAKGFEFDVELLWRMKRKDLSIIEVPVIWNDTENSRLRVSDTISMFKSLIKIRIGLY